MRSLFSLAIVVGLILISSPFAYAGPETSKPDTKQADAKKAGESASDKAETKKADAKKPEATKAETAKPADKKAEPAVKKVSVVRFTLKGTLPEGPSSPGLFGDLQTSLSTLVERLE